MLIVFIVEQVKARLLGLVGVVGATTRDLGTDPEVDQEADRGAGGGRCGPDPSLAVPYNEDKVKDQGRHRYLKQRFPQLNHNLDHRQSLWWKHHK